MRKFTLAKSSHLMHAMFTEIWLGGVAKGDAKDKVAVCGDSFSVSWLPPRFPYTPDSSASFKFPRSVILSAEAHQIQDAVPMPLSPEALL